jgi:hypothetical protein
VHFIYHICDTTEFGVYYGIPVSRHEVHLMKRIQVYFLIYYRLACICVSDMWIMSCVCRAGTEPHVLSYMMTHLVSGPHCWETLPSNKDSFQVWPMRVVGRAFVGASD